MPLSINLLGHFSARLDDLMLDTFATAKVRALLAYLAVEGTQPLDRSYLAGLLWPDIAEESARGNFRHALSNLRKGIKDKSSEPPLLLINRKIVQLNSDAIDAGMIQTDVGQFQTLYQRARSDTNAAEKAIALYQGPFLEHFGGVDDSPEFEQWMQLQRERLHRQMGELLGQVSQQRLDNGQSSGDFDPAVAMAQRLVDHDPWREEAHVLLMTALWHDGQGDAAMKQFERCRRVLKEELDVAPSPETEALYQAIRDNRSEFGVPVQALPKLGEAAEGRDYDYDDDYDYEGRDHNIPPLLKPFFGREEELAEIGRLFAQPTCRLVIVVGPGGMGKTELVTAFARAQIESEPAKRYPIEQQANKYPDGIWLVSLTGISSGSQIPTAIGQALGIVMVAEQEPRDRILTYLYDKTLLLILDNFEHLLDSVAIVSDILQRAPDVCILGTSRERLNLQIETVYNLGGLAIPQPLLHFRPPASNRLEEELAEQSDPIMNSSAVQLFVDCARRVSGGFELTVDNAEDVLRICRLTDGMPLGIELAAVWTRVLSCADIAQSLIESMELLSTTMPDVPKRHRSIRALFNDSWQRIGEAAQRLFAQLSIFRGGFRLDAMTAITNGTLFDLVELIDRSFVSKDENDRYTIHELMRQFGSEKLSQEIDTAGSSVEQRVEDTYAIYYAAMLDNAVAGLTGPAQVETAAQISREIDNVRHAWDLAVNAHAFETLSQGLDGWYHFHQVRSLEYENAETLERTAATLAGNRDAAPFMARLNAYLASSLYLMMEIDRCRETATESLRLAKETGEILAEARANLVLGQVMTHEDFEASMNHYNRALILYEQEANDEGVSQTYIGLGRCIYQQNQPEQMLEYGELALAAAERSANPFLTGFSLNTVGSAYITLTRYDDARAVLMRSLEIFEHLQNILMIADMYNNLAIASIYEGDRESAYRLYRRSYRLHQKIGLTTSSMTNADNLARCAIQLGKLDEAQLLFDETTHHAEVAGDTYRWLRCRQGHAYVDMKRGDLIAARAALAPLLSHPELASSRLVQGIYVDTIATFLKEEENLVDAASVFAFVREHFTTQPAIYGRAGTMLDELSASIGTDILEKIQAKVKMMSVEDIFSLYIQADPTRADPNQSESE